MAKRTEPTRRKTADEIGQEVAAALETLSVLCAAFENGKTGVVFSMATEVVKITKEAAGAVRDRAERHFLTVQDEPPALNAAHKLISIRVSSSPPSVGCVAKPLSFDPVRLRWKDWWRKDMIYIAGHAPGEAGGIILIKDPPSDESRRRWTREDFVQLVRNKLGAHIGPEIPEDLSAFSEAGSLSAIFSVGFPSAPELVPNPPLAAAMMHRIALEVLNAYGLTGSE